MTPVIPASANVDSSTPVQSPDSAASLINCSGVLDSAGVTLPVYCRVAVAGGVAESVALIVKSYAPLTLGVPVIAPVLGFKVSPVGSAPLVTA
ncbi:hypothetical protein D3C81_1566520 [compost metagenome]